MSCSVSGGGFVGSNVEILSSSLLCILLSLSSVVSVRLVRSSGIISSGSGTFFVRWRPDVGSSKSDVFVSSRSVGNVCLELCPRSSGNSCRVAGFLDNASTFTLIFPAL